MTAFEVLLLAHVFGDWLLQTEWQAQNKASNWRALFTHVIVYHIPVYGVLAWRYGPGDLRIYAALAALAAVHAFLDRGWPVQRLMRGLRIVVNRPSERWLTIAVDQSLHILLLGACTLYLG